MSATNLSIAKHILQNNDKMLPFTFDLKANELIMIQNKDDFSILKEMLNGAILLGIDTETKPSFYKKKNNCANPTALLQVAVRNKDERETTFIIDLLELNNVRDDMICLDSILKMPLIDEKCLIIGQGLDRDFRELSSSYPFMESFKYVNSVVEMTYFVTFLEPDVVNMVSLKYLVGKYLNCNLIKKQQTSNWGARPLTHDQIYYAACDALVLIRLYDAMVCEMDQVTCFDDCFLLDDDNYSGTASDAHASALTTESFYTDSPAAVEEKKPFDIASVLSVIDVSVPVISKKRSFGSLSGEVDSSTEVVSQYVKDWTSPAARQWYSNQLNLATTPPNKSTKVSSDNLSITTNNTGSSSHTDVADDSSHVTIGSDSTKCGSDGSDGGEEEDIHIPLPTGLGKHVYL